MDVEEVKTINYYPPASTDLLRRVVFKTTLFNYIYNTNAVGTDAGSIYAIEENVYDKIEKIFSGKPGSVNAGDKVFVLPNHRFTYGRLKEYLKSKDASLVKDISKATVVFGSAESSVKDKTNVSALMMMFQHHYSNPAEDNTIFTHDIPGCNFVMSYDLGRNNHPSNFKCGYNPNPQHLITESGLNIIMTIVEKKLKVIDEESVVKEATCKQSLLDDSFYENISSMLDSSNNDDIAIGLRMLFHSDLSEWDISDVLNYRMWKIACKHYSIIEYRLPKTKSSKSFILTIDLHELRCMNTDDFLDYLKEKDILKNEMKDILLDILLKDNFQHLRINEEKFEKNIVNGGIKISYRKDYLKTLEYEED